MDRGRRKAVPHQLRTLPSVPSQISTASHGDRGTAHAGAGHADRGRHEVRALLRDPLMFNQLKNSAAICLMGWTLLSSGQVSSPTPRVIELTADKDSKYRLGDKVAPTIEVSPGEHLILRITAVRARQVARDGSVHGLALLDKDENVVPGWRFYLHPGIQELQVTAPQQPGHYSAVCIVICSDMHEDMGFTLVVTQASAR